VPPVLGEPVHRWPEQPLLCKRPDLPKERAFARDVIDVEGEILLDL
jgi:hypothetical protein